MKKKKMKWLVKPQLHIYTYIYYTVRIKVSITIGKIQFLYTIYIDFIYNIFMYI